MSDDFSIDDMMGDLGPVDSPYAKLSPEDQFLWDYTSGKYAKLYNLRYWLNCELSVYNTLAERGYTMVKSSRDVKLQVSVYDLSRGLIEHYLLMNHAPRFSTVVNNKPKCDLNATIEKFMEHDEIKRTIKQYTS